MPPAIRHKNPEPSMLPPRDDPRQMLEAAFAAHDAGDAAGAERRCRDVLAAMPDQPDALQLLGVIKAQAGHLTEAESLLRRAVGTAPHAALAHLNLGHVLNEQGRREEALGAYTAALADAPDLLPAALQRSVLLGQLGRDDEALAGFDAILAKGENADAFYHRGNSLKRLGRLDDAILDYDRALAIQPDDVEALYNRGNALLALGQAEAAVATYDRALAIAADYPDALNNRGIALLDLGHAADALASFEAALAAAPRFAAAHYNRGNALRHLMRFEEAVASYDAALAIDPHYAQAANNRGSALMALKRVRDAIASFDRAIAARPDDAEALYNRAQALLGESDHPRAVVDLNRLQELQSEGKAFFDYLAGDLLHARMHCCDWTDFVGTSSAVIAGVRAGERVCDPFAFVALSDSPADHRRCAEIFAADRFPTAGTAPRTRGESPQDKTRSGKMRLGKIRLGYVSGEFCEQATAFLIVELLERHDKSRFEVHGFDNGIDDGSIIRKRLTGAFDTMTSIARLDDDAAAQAIRDAHIDVLINLNGYFGEGRNGVFARRPSAVQVNYLGFPGTLGGDFVDYIVADRHVIPEADQVHYREKVVVLPDCYQPNDSKRTVIDEPVTRAASGLPEHGFVFCSFNNNYKLTPAMFDRWMNILRAVDGSVLWLLEGNAAVAGNLRREAAGRGIDPSRLVFAPRIAPAQHLARHRLADLCLDTLPYNAHTTASDALWAGLPVLTCTGTTFAGRVAGSLLQAVGLPEMIAPTLDHYERAAVRLARVPQALADIRTRLLANRTTHPLFDTARYRRHIEAAYETMWQRHLRGEPPESFAVAPLGEATAVGE